jgi:hypothetical protein
MVLIKIHESYRKVVAVCDSSLVGKKFEEGKMQLDVRKNFYNGKEVSDEKAFQMLNSLSLDDATFNIVGEESVKIAKKAGIIDDANVGKIGGVKFALVLM